MKSIGIYTLSVVLAGSITLSSCDISSSRNYLGTMAGAEIGGVIGEALGWMSTDRHDGPGKAMLGSVVGTVAGAAIGNYITKDKTDSSSRDYNSDYSSNYSSDYNGNSNYNSDYSSNRGGYDDSYNMGYQTGGGSDAVADNYRGKENNRGKENKKNGYHIDSNSSLTISNVQYQDEDGDGRFSRNETVNIIYEVKNNSRQTVRNVELKVEAENNSKCFALSPTNVIDIPAGETIRYKAKAFCKSRPSDSTTTFKVSANSNASGKLYAELQIRMNK